MRGPESAVLGAVGVCWGETTVSSRERIAFFSGKSPMVISKEGEVN